ncbi:MAG: hypothetical protein IKC49_00230 [Clostridia bacterium]|nr:hypothetical protein [Clostridia bacterium]
MDKIDIRTLSDEVFDDFFNNYIRMYLKNNGNMSFGVNEYVRFNLNGPCVLGKFELISRANKHKQGSFILSALDCKVCTDDSKSNEYLSNPKLKKAWQNTLVGIIEGYQELLNKYYSTDEEINF